MAIQLTEIEREELENYWRILSGYPQIKPEIKLRRNQSGALVVLTWIDGSGSLHALDPVFEAEIAMKIAIQKVRAHLRLDPRVRGVDGDPDLAEEFELFQPVPPQLV